jgi:hypothetical protein
MTSNTCQKTSSSINNPVINITTAVKANSFARKCCVLPKSSYVGNQAINSKLILIHLRIPKKWNR